MTDLPSIQPELDAYLHWAIRTDFLYYAIGPKRRAMLLVRFRTRISLLDIRAARAHGVLIAGAYDGHQFATASVPVIEIDKALGRLREMGAEFCELASPVASIETQLVEPPMIEHFTPGGPQTVIGVIDDGCPFAHIGARRTDHHALQVRSIWDQGGVWDQGGAPKRAGLGYGRVYGAEELNGLIEAAKSPATGTVDEDVAYELSGLPSLRTATSHGAQVLSHAIGYAPAEFPPANPPGRADVVFVQLPPEALDDPSGGWLNHYALDGIHHICNYARDRHAVKASVVVINLSYGPQTGPHNGKSNFEMAIDELVETATSAGYILKVVVPSGNGHLARAHGEFVLDSVPRGGSLDWCVAVDSQAPSYLELWLPDQVSVDDLDLTLTSPDGRQLVGRAGSFHALDDNTAAVVCPPGSPMVMLFVAPTAYGRDVSGNPSVRLGIPGRWKVAVSRKADSSAAGTVHAYLARRDPNMGRQRRGRSGYLDSPTYDPNRFMRESDQLERPAGVGAEVVAAGSMNGIATGQHTLVVGGSRASDAEPSRYSAGGPTRGARAGPDWSYVTDSSQVVLGIASGGNRSATVTRLVGTSVAAPQCAREVASDPGGKLPDVRGPSSSQPARQGSGVRKPRGKVGFDR